MTTLVFDNTPLSHFARAGLLDVLRQTVAGHRCVTLSEVVHELEIGVADHPTLADVIVAHWLETVELEDLPELVAFARYKAEFGGGPGQNEGESAVLAWVSVHGGTAVMDDGVAVRAARRDGIDVHGTLWLVANALKMGVVDDKGACRVVDDLRATDMRIPVDGKGFLSWAYDERLLP